MASRLHSYAFRRTLRVAGFVMVSLGIVAALGYGFVRVFSIQRVEVDGQGISIELDKTKLGENLLLIPTERLTHELLSAYPLLSSVRFEKQFPGTLVIHLVKRVPLVLVVTNGADYVVDADGVVLDNATSIADYPVLQFDVGLLAIGSRVKDAKIMASLVFLNALHGTPVISRMSDGGSTFIQAVMGDTNILFPQTGDLRTKADTLQTIVEGFRIKGALPAVIDLRFEKPIVTN